MKFNIVSPEESKTCGKLRFSAPIQEEIEKASKEIWQLCCDRRCYRLCTLWEARIRYGIA